jgi:hypothetical protein
MLFFFFRFLLSFPVSKQFMKNNFSLFTFGKEKAKEDFHSQRQRTRHILKKNTLFQNFGWRDESQTSLMHHNEQVVEGLCVFFSSSLRGMDSLARHFYQKE